jgi:hypothetical protein
LRAIDCGIDAEPEQAGDHLAELIEVTLRLRSVGSLDLAPGTVREAHPRHPSSILLVPPHRRLLSHRYLPQQST